MDSLRAMAIFARVVSTGSMSAAARELGMSTSAVSQQVRALEQGTGVALLHRTTRRLTLTAAGSGFYEGCADMLAAADRARQRLAEQRDAPVGELRLTAPHHFASTHLGPALAPLLRANPHLTLRILATDTRLDLVDARIDLAIRVGRLADSSQVARPLAEWENVLVASPAWLAQSAPLSAPEDLAQADFLLLTPLGEPQELALTRGGETRRVRLKGRAASDSQQTLLALARLGLGVAREVDANVAEDLAQGTLVRVLPDWRLPPVGVWAVTPQREAQPAKVRHAIEALRQYLAARAPAPRGLV